MLEGHWYKMMVVDGGGEKKDLVSELDRLLARPNCSQWTDDRSAYLGSNRTVRPTSAANSPWPSVKKKKRM